MVLEIPKDYGFKTGSREELGRQIEQFVKERNPKLDTSTAAYRAFIDRLTTIVMERNGRLVADDYNFNARGRQRVGSCLGCGRPTLCCCNPQTARVAAAKSGAPKKAKGV